MDVLFLDANVLFSRAYKETSALHRLWELPDVAIVTSSYAVEEADRNLRDAERRERLRQRLGSIRVLRESADLRAVRASLPHDQSLPEDDLPILAGAIASGASHLLTGDRRHFGALWCRTIGGAHVMKPADYLAGHEKRSPGRSP